MVGAGKVSVHVDVAVLTEEQLTETTDGQHPRHHKSYMNPVKFVQFLT